MQKHIPQLDAVRGVAILLVLVHNLYAFTSPPLSYLSVYGWMGVDLFFVLSGFLITGILLDTKPDQAYFRNFYARRCLRIWPLYYSVLLVMFVLVPLLHPQNAAEIFQRSSPWWSYPFFLQNFLVADPSLTAGPLGVSWSLAVEELFYLVWPAFVRFLSVRQLRAAAWSVVLLSPFLRLFFVSHNWLIYTNPFCRIDGLMAGALLAILVRKSGFVPARFVFPARLAVLLGGPLAIAVELHNDRWLTFSLDTLAFTGFVYLAMFSGNAWFKACMTNRFLIFTGTISYGLYLLHKLPFDTFKILSFYEAYPRLTFWVSLILSYALAFASWKLLEQPFLRLKRFFETASSSVDSSASPVSSAQISDQ
jgi:peptidoglycan/LPS O-acetylase OafA/YrhL